MNKLILLLTVVTVSIFSNRIEAQKFRKNKTKSQLSEQKISTLDSIIFGDIDKLIGNIEYKNSIIVNNYKTKFDNWIKIGDTLEIGKPSNMNNLEANLVSGTRVATVYHSHIFLGSVGAVLMGTAMFGNQTMTGDKVFVTKILMSRTSKRNSYKVFIEFNKVGGGRFLGTKKLGRASLEVSLESGEIINPNRGMTRDEAIKKLKQAKELMELDMISKDEFEKLKLELGPIIKKGM